MIFEVVDQFHRRLQLTKERFEHILEHPEMNESETERIKETLLVPDVIKQSKHDKKVWLYYKLYEKTPVTKKQLVVVVKVLNHRGFVITSFFTDKVKEGITVWQR